MMGRWIGAGLLAAALAACSGGRPANEATALDYFKRGNAAYHREDYRHAIRMYRQAAELDPRSAAIQYNLGLASYQAGNFSEAVQAFQRALRLDPNLAEAHRNLALAEDRLYNLDAAQTHYNIYQAMMRAREPDAAAPEKAPEVLAPPPGSPAGPKPKAAPPPEARSKGGESAPEPVSQVRRYGSPANGSARPAPSQGDGKWWTQDSSRTR